MARFAKFWPPIVSAALLILAFPPFHLGLLVFVALAPWIASLEAKSGREGFKSGYVFGLVFFGSQFIWLAQFVGRWTNSLGMGLVPAVACTLIGSLYFGWAGWLMTLCLRRRWMWAIPLVWAGVEVFRSFIFGLAFPWGLVHTPLYTLPGLVQLAHFGTAYLVSAWIVLVNVCAAMFLLKRPRAEMRNFMMVALALGGASYAQYTTPMSGAGKRILIAQPGVDMAFGDPATERMRSFEALAAVFARVKPLGKFDLLLLPEGAAENEGVFPPNFTPPTQAPVLLGGSRREGSKYYQSAFGFDGKWSYADKRRIVIFGEYVPFRDQLPFLKGFDLPSGDLSPAEKTTALTLGDLKVGPLLCFEGLFADVAHAQAANGAQLLAVMSIDDWYMGSPAPEQLMAASVFRAVETGLPVARSASTGISVAVDQRGNLLRMAPIGDQRMLDVELICPERSDTSEVATFVPWVFIASLAIFPLADVWFRRRERRQENKAP